MILQNVYQKLCFAGLLFASCSLYAANAPTHFRGHISRIPPQVQQQMRHYTWHKGCPVPLKALRYLQLPYWGFDDQAHMGVLIVHRALAHEVVGIFESLYQHRFPIERMELMDTFKGNDDASMAANNTSGFNCRNLTGHPGMFSQHSYGRAIDINPRINPYVSPQTILPPNGRSFVSRSLPYSGKILKKSFIYHLFIRNGWDWAGNWFDVQDYQHFEKRANGERRNPYGYTSSHMP